MASQSTPSVTSGGNLPGQSNSGSSSVSSRSDVSGPVPSNPPAGEPMDTSPPSSTDARHIFLLAIEAVDRSFQRLTTDVKGYIFDLSDREYSSLHFYCQQRVGTLLYGPLSSVLPDLPKTKDEFMVGLSKYWNALSFGLFEDVVGFFNTPVLFERLTAHTDLLGRFCRMTLGECRKRGIKLHKSQYLTITYQEDPTKFALGRILEFQEFLKKNCGIEQSLFAGFDTGSVILFFLISHEAASQLQSKLDDAALSSLGVCRIKFEGQWEISLQTQGTHPGSVMYSQTSSSSEEPGKGKEERAAPQDSLHTEVKRPSPKMKRTSYSHITAKDVVQSIGKEELIKKFIAMLTDHRTVLLEARDFVDSDCRDSIQAKLRLGHRAGAATELVEYFEANHDGDKIMEFCAFLEDQAGSTAPVLKKLAKVIQGRVEMLSAPVPGPSKVHVSSNPEEGSYSHVRAKNVLQTFRWLDLRRDVEDMFTKSQVYTLEGHYALIDSSCNAKIRSDLERGDPGRAATTLINYFQKNHNGDDMLRFCKFLRDEAGGTVVLEDLADRIERTVKSLGASGST